MLLENLGMKQDVIFDCVGLLIACSWPAEPYRTMQTYTRASRTKKWSHNKLLDARNFRIRKKNILGSCFFLSHKKGVCEELRKMQTCRRTTGEHYVDFFATCRTVTSSVQIRRCWRPLVCSAVCMARCGLPAAFVWLCKHETIEDHVACHATVVRKCTRPRAYSQQPFAVYCG